MWSARAPLDIVYRSVFLFVNTGGVEAFEVWDVVAKAATEARF